MDFAKIEKKLLVISAELGRSSGLVRFKATANNAVNYSFRFGTGDSEESSSGSVEYTYIQAGNHSYNINVLAYSSTNDFISISENIDVYVAVQSDPDLSNVLTGGSQKSWKLNAAYDPHFTNGENQFKYPTWWEASAFSKSNSGFYDDKFIFKSDGTYIHETNGDVYGKANYLNQTFGNTGQPINGSNEIEKYSVNKFNKTCIHASRVGRSRIIGKSIYCRLQLELVSYSKGYFFIKKGGK